MNIKFEIPLILLATALMQSPLQGQGAATPVPVADLKDEDSFDTIYRSYVEVQIDKTTTDEIKSALKMRFLVIAHNYIKTHTRPEGVVWMNMQPPDGSMSGVAPEAVKDPEMRAKYIKMLAENDARGEGQARYDSLILLRKEILASSVLFLNLKPGNAKIIAEALAKYSKDAAQATELKKLIDTMAAEKKSQPPQWPTSSGEAPAPNSNDAVKPQP